jgi:hypothetical protein
MARVNKGKFQPGESGNPDGRPKGSKNKITLLKESLELLLRERSESKMVSVLDQAIALAMEGDRSMIKLLLELHMSKGTTQDGSKAIEKVEINISGPEEIKSEKAPAKQEKPALPTLN